MLIFPLSFEGVEDTIVNSIQNQLTLKDKY